MKVLSLFDGISCGMTALERAGIPVERYAAYEIDKYAIKISEKNYPLQNTAETYLTEILHSTGVLTY